MAARPIGTGAAPAFTWPVRVYWEDTDAGGVVYHANYLRFFERARSEWLRAAGIGQEQLRAELGIVFVVHGMDIRFNRPARLDDALLASVRVEALRGASFEVAQTLVREREPAISLVDARVRIACLDAERWRPRPIPESLLQEIVRP
ncbi:MAG TPA: tol-pal system-associated acyl-CoA thioesterase [Dokdonella sp.]|uniref:tol-pal system-associated acyl-CoA thioesterase n=1 Tax=Dokdonella sp. TaxID=2291710 RepID=UPI0025C6820D|nr:tol-pal system-associated acyl-CoA thioesterase [Dokdonella sp.]MBX3692134.1 tol-pal system-associated acyl-CoA thioesterase [Dokdonella sp.]MCW5567328.1 tol-pal system-associated acyl-CoA thioesterase [Dokdonella sp.]HNR92901.1 tol-pal system-associated acyl-CoA thioesterase [Dokdonella sp.]